MSRFADLVIKEDRTAEENQELHVLAQQLDYVVADVGTAIGPSGVISHLRAGSVVLDNAGLHTFLGGVETGRIEADGDFLLGSNIATAANTSFAVFTNAQTYNSESIGEGDLLVGDNTASKANILWDKSAGTLLFRGGTTTQGYIATDGSAVFGAGNVILDGDGIRLSQGSGDANRILWTASPFGAGDHLGYMGLSKTGARNDLAIAVSGIAPDNDSVINIELSSVAGASTHVLMSARGKAGGAGVGGLTAPYWYVRLGDVNRFGGDATQVIFNDEKKDVDLHIHGDTVDDVLKVDAGLDKGYYLGTEISVASVDAQYVTLAVDATLANERVLTGTANQVVITDNGAGSTVVLSTPQDIHTTATPQFGTLGIGTAATALRGINLVKTFTDGTASNTAQYNQFAISSNSNSTVSQRALSFVALAQGSGGSTGGLIGLIADVQNQQTAGTWGTATAASLVTRNTNASALITAVGVQHAFVVSGTGNIFNASDFIARSPVLSSTGIITNHYGFYVQNLGNAKQTNSWGVYVAAQSGSTTKNYAIYTNAGDIALNAGADGATTVVIGGATPQTNGGFLQIESGWTFKETAAPTADTNYGKMWTNTSDELWFQDGAGVNHLLHGDAFSEIWFHGATPAVVTISTEDALTLVNSFAVVGHEDDSSNVVGNISTDTLTLSANGGGEYEISYHASITATGAKKEVMSCVGSVLATAKDITDVTDDTVSPIVITSTAHGLNNGDMVEIVGVLGNTAANGSFIVANKATDTFQIVALDGTATTGNGDFDEGSPTGDVTIWYLGNMVTRRVVSQTDLGSISATGLHVLQNGDVLSLYIANLDDTSNINIYAVSLDANRIGD